MNRLLVNILGFEIEIIDLVIYGLIVLLGIILIIFLVTTLSKEHSREKKIKNYISAKSNIKIYSIDFEKNKVYIVDKRNLKDKKTKSLEWFFDSFSEDEYIKIKVWFTEIIRKDPNKKEYIEVYSKAKNHKHLVYTILSCSHVDYEKKIIHLESKMYPEARYKKKYSYANYVSYGDIQNDYNNHDKSTIYIITLCSLKSDNSFKNQFLTTLLISHIRRILGDNLYMTRLYNNEFLIYDAANSDKNQCFNFVTNLEKTLNRVILISNYNDSVSYFISSYINKNKKVSLKTAVFNCHKVIEYLKYTKSYGQFNLYDEKENYDVGNKVLDSFENLKESLRDSHYALKCNAIYSRGARVDGYIFDFSQEDIYKDFVSLQDFARSNHYLAELFDSYINTVLDIITTGNKRKNRTIYFPSKLIYSNIFIKVIKEKKLDKDVKFIFSIKDSEIINLQNENPDLVDKYFSDIIDEEQISFGVEFTAPSLEFSNDLLDRFDYYVFNQKDDYPNILQSSQKNILLNNLVSILKENHQVELFAMNLNSFNEIEYFYNLGFINFSSDYFGFGINQLPNAEAKRTIRLAQLKDE